MARIAVTYPLPGHGLERLAERHEVRVHRGGGRLAGRALAEFAAGAEALVPLISDGVDAEVFAACPRLRVVANVGVGTDHIDLEAARAAGVWVTNTPDVLTDATADLTWALILAVTRRVVEGDALVRRGGFTGWRLDFMLGAGLQSRTLGIVGMGRIGRAVARRAVGFGVRVRYTSRRAEPLAPEGAGRAPSLDELLPTVDILSLHCPLTPATRGLIGAGQIARLPRGAFLVNTSRGEVVDEGAVAAALEAGHLGGAALDVFEREPEVHPGLVGRSDVVLLPHLGSATWEARTAMAGLAVDNALAVLAGRTPPTPVVTPAEG